MREILPSARRYAGQVAASAGSQPIAMRIAVAGVVGVALFSIVLLRLWALTVMSGSEYAQLAQQNQIRQLSVEAPRGAIVDRNGRPFVTNRAAREVVLNLQDVPERSRPVLYRRLARTLGVSAREISATVDAHAADTLTPIVVARDITDEKLLFYLEEHAAEFPGVNVRDRFVRNYVAGATASHVLGQVGEVSGDQLKGDFANLQAGDRVGQSGLERSYDAYLRGTDGYRAMEVDAAGVRKGDGRGVPATPGHNLRLTIDMQLQRATERALQEGIRIARGTSAGRSSTAGAAVAMDPRTGEVLAMASAPTYDPNIFVTSGNDKEVVATLKDKRTPLSNRAIAGLYPPGSTYKVITALAAMQEGFVTPTTPISCPASMKIAGTSFRNWTDQPLGAVTLPTALEVSCDTYFYALGLQFYNMPGSRLQDWSRRFGLGTSSHIDIPGEEQGVLPTPAWRKQTFDSVESIWSPGHSVNLSIGQGDLLVTPLQMTRAYAAIADGGVLREPRIARSVEDPSGKQVIDLPRGASQTLPFTAPQLNAVRQGLYQAANGVNGTSTAVFATFPIPVAGKTGTAEKPPYGDMAWYCGYAPATSPTIVACAIVENGGHGGTAAAPVVLRMFQRWFRTGGGNVGAGVVSD